MLPNKQDEIYLFKRNCPQKGCKICPYGSKSFGCTHPQRPPNLTTSAIEHENPFSKERTKEEQQILLLEHHTPKPMYQQKQKE